MINRSLLAFAAYFALLPYPAMAGAGGWFSPQYTYGGIAVIIILAIIIYLIWGRRRP